MSVGLSGLDFLSFDCSQSRYLFETNLPMEPNQMSNTTPTAYTHIAVFGAREGVKRSKTMTKFLKVREGRDVAGVIESHIDVDPELDGRAYAIYTIAGAPEYHAAAATAESEAD